MAVLIKNYCSYSSKIFAYIIRQPNYRAIDSVNCMKSSEHTNDDKANCKYKTISFYIFTLSNASN